MNDMPDGRSRAMDELPAGQNESPSTGNVWCWPMSRASFARSDGCGHKNAPLSRGKLDGYLIECPLHFAQFDVRTGHLVNGPVSTSVAVYEVRVEGDTVYVRR